MEKKNNLRNGIIFLVAGLLFVTWMKEDSISLLGILTLQCNRVGKVLLVIAAYHLLVEFSQNKKFSDLIVEILVFPLRVIGWVFEYWYLSLAVVALLFWLGPKEEAPEQEEPLYTYYESAVTEMPVPETQPVWVPPTEPAMIQQPYPGMHRNAGLCKNLTQDAQILMVFVNDSSSNWTNQEIQSFLSNLVEPSLGYIEYKAQEYGYFIDLQTCWYPDAAGNAAVLNYNGSVADWDSESVDENMPYWAAECYGFFTLEDMIKNIQEYSAMDQVAIAFCLDKPGRSYALWDVNTNDFVEYAVMFTSQYGSRNRADMVAHELMHLFGADDMYAGRGEGENRAILAQRWHPKELFFQGQWNLYENVISPYTAYAVGWLDVLPTEYDCPEWWS